MMQEDKGTQLYPNLPQQIQSGEGNNDLNKAENGQTRTDSTTQHNRSSKPPHDGYGGGQGGFGQEEDEIKDYKYFWRRVLKDLTNKNLIPVKVLFFFKYATLFVLYPFLTLHMDALGLDEWEIGVNQASVPIVAIFGPPVSGMIADKIGNFKIVLSFITLINAAVALLLLLVPVARETVTLPSLMTFEVGCDPLSSNFMLQSLGEHTCTMSSMRWPDSPRLTLIQCGHLCSKIGNDSSANVSQGFPKFPLDPNATYSIQLNDKTYTFYQEFVKYPRIVCGSGDGCKLKYERGLDLTFEYLDSPINAARQDFQRKLIEASHYKISLGNLHLLTNTSLSNNNDHAKLSMNVTKPQIIIDGPITFGSELHQHPSCAQPSPSSLEELEDTGCETKCFIQMERKLFCANKSERKVYNVWLTFSLYTLFRILLGFASATSFIMFEGAVLAIIKQYGGDYGLQRVSATFAAILAAPLSGFLLQTYSFKPVFYLYAALQAFSAFLTLKIDLKFKKPSDDVLGHLRDVLSHIEILIFFFAMLCAGTLWGYLETFLFLFLKTLGATKTLMGLTISVGGFFGLPFLIFSRPLIKRIGHVNILCIGFLFYGIRYFGYSVINDPWLCLPFEALESITASLAITAAATYAVALSSLQTIATVQGIMGALYFGIGRGAGSFIGGILIKKFGHRQTFQIFGLSAFAACLLYMIVNVLYVRRHSKASSGIDINNMSGLVISNNGARKSNSKDGKEQIQMKPADYDSELGYGKVNPVFEDGDLDDGAKFTDIPLDEENPVPSQPNNNVRSRQRE